MTPTVQAEIDAMVTARPAAAYKPGRSHDLDGNPIDPRDNGQLQFHNSLHVIRLMAPGNGFGKTGSLAVEMDWWGHRDHPYQTIPDAPLTMIWVCRTFGHWERIRKDIEAWWPRYVTASWVGQPKNTYTWPNGTTMHLVTAETDPGDVQGIQPHLVVCDERFPADLWHELIKRRRGHRKTRFCIGATATDGLDWSYHELYLPWKKYHEAQGILDEREMMRQQLHRWDDPALVNLPGIWCWPCGGHYDNPTATKETWAVYQVTTKGHPAERHIRLHGGWRDFAGQPVFNPEQLELMRKLLRPGRTGQIVEVSR